MNLTKLGFSPFFEQHLDAMNPDGHRVGRVAREERDRWEVVTEAGPLRATATGSLRQQQRSPRVGDWVVVEPLPAGAGRIHGLFPRKTQLVRKAAGEATEAQVVAVNLDTVFIVCGLDGELNLRRLERYLTVVWESGALPVVLLNKQDLAGEVEEDLEEVELAACGAPVHPVSARTGAGLEALSPYLEAGRTVALVGSSGVGKSSLANRLLGAERQSTGPVRATDGRGRHTTTRRELFCLPTGGVLIDTPGMRALGLWQADGMSQSFQDVEQLADGCRFRDCQHLREPHCAVQAAVDGGELAADRLESYFKLQRELAWLARKQDARAAQQERARIKRRTVHYRRRSQSRDPRRNR